MLTRCKSHGFTLVELMCVLAVAALLAAIAYPAFTAIVLRSHRSDALVALTQLQGAQERFRTAHPRYAEFDELAVPAQSPQRHFALSVADHSEDGFAALASAVGRQQGDSACRFFKLIVQGAMTTQASGADDTTSNTPEQNKRCWGL